MGRKRRLISKPQKFGNKHSAHPLIDTDAADTTEMGLSEERSVLAQEATTRTAEPVDPPPAPSEEKREAAPAVASAPPPKKRATRKRTPSSRRARPSRKTKAKTEASA